MKALARFLCAAIAVVAVASCTANGGSIYYAIQNVQKIGNSTLPTDLTITDIVNSAPTGNGYYIAAGSVFNGPVPSPGGTITWTKVGPPPGMMMCNALGFDGTNLWAGYFSLDGSTFGLYKGTITAGSYANVTWALETTLGTPSGKQINYIAYVNGNIFVGAGAPNGGGPFELDVFTLGPPTWTTLLSGLQYPVTGVAFFNPNYYVTTSYFTTGTVAYPKVYVSSGGVPSLTFSDITANFPGSPGNEIFQGLFSDSGHVILAMANQNLYFSTDGTSWTQLSDKPVSGYNAGFLAAAGPLDASYSNGGIYYVGTDSTQGGGAGFYIFTLAGRSISRYVNLSISLYIDAIRRVLYDSANNVVFFGTINSGLWRTSVDSSGNPQTWFQE